MPVMQKLKFEKQRGEGQGWERLGGREERVSWQELQLLPSGQKRPPLRPHPSQRHRPSALGLRAVALAQGGPRMGQCPSPWATELQIWGRMEGVPRRPVENA